MKEISTSWLRWFCRILADFFWFIFLDLLNLFAFSFNQDADSVWFFIFLIAMEHGSFTDETKSTFSMADEDHTLANALRYTLNQEYELLFSYSWLNILKC